MPHEKILRVVYEKGETYVAETLLSQVKLIGLDAYAVRGRGILHYFLSKKKNRSKGDVLRMIGLWHPTLDINPVDHLRRLITSLRSMIKQKERPRVMS